MSTTNCAYYLICWYSICKIKYFPQYCYYQNFLNLFESRTKFDWYIDGNFYLRILLVALRRTCIVGITLWPKKKTITNLHTKLHLCIHRKNLISDIYVVLQLLVFLCFEVRTITKNWKTMTDWQNCPSERQNCPFQIMRNGLIEKWKFEMTEVSFNWQKCPLADRSVLLYFWRDRTVLFT